MFRLPIKYKTFFRKHAYAPEAIEIFKYIGPGFLVTVGFIDPGNWAANMAAGASYGYMLLWVITLAMLMLIIIQHNAAHLGIVTGLCLSEACEKFFKKRVSAVIILSAMVAAISTALAELLGAAIGLNMLFGIPLPAGALVGALFAGYMVFSNSYNKLEKWIIIFVSLIGFSFLYEVNLVHIDWFGSSGALKSLVSPSIPNGSLPVIMSVLGAVVMPHNIFLHSEVIQSKQINLEGDERIKKRLRYEFLDTIAAMSAGWAINCAMILVAASLFYSQGARITGIEDAYTALRPALGSLAGAIFAIALLLSGLSSSVTAALSGASIFAGAFGEPLNLKDNHSKTGALITLGSAFIAILFISDAFTGLIWSQIVLAVQLPLTVFPLIVLTSSKRVMGKYQTPIFEKLLLWICAALIAVLNIMLVADIIRPGSIEKAIKLIH
ncbi:divalent metal cation transporter [bacterium]|nr:MAG: divalent metal cation transporter [bacterium]